MRPINHYHIDYKQCDQSDFVDSQKAFNVSLVSLFSISKACHLFVDWHQINILASTIEQLSPRVLCGLAGGV